MARDNSVTRQEPPVGVQVWLDGRKVPMQTREWQGVTVQGSGEDVR